MQPAKEQTVLGDFNGASFTHFSVGARFFKKDGAFFVNTDGADGQNADFRVSYTFGVHPLQQYLIELPGGHLQALSVCWDTRPREDGGQRWFHLYPDEKITHDDVLHWTGPNQNWNFMCAECHSTNLQKGYDAPTNTYKTTWSQIDVGCEACHGPGSRHVSWAEARKPNELVSPEQTLDDDPNASAHDATTMGLTARLREPHPGQWVLDPATRRYRRDPPLESNVQLNTCARCHARRHVLEAPHEHGRPLLDHYQPALLTEALYHADGQILDEVYVYGSFLQSKMHHRGVRCSDCHDPHGLNLHAPGNALCVRCHLSDEFDTPKHHFHEPGSKGAGCVSCHMPSRYFMVVDKRYDHSFRVPRPDLSVKIGTPNACNDCHLDRDAAWSAAAINKWHGPRRANGPDPGEVLHAGRRDPRSAAPLLAVLAQDAQTPGIKRATALELLANVPTASTLAVLGAASRDPDALVRLAAAGGLGGYAPAQRLVIAGPLLTDPVRAVRIHAARMLAPVRRGMFTKDQAAAFERGLNAFVRAQRVNADRASAHLNLGNLHIDRGELKEAEASFRTAIRLEPQVVQPYVNLADLHRAAGREDDCERMLRRAVSIAPGTALAHHALGLSLSRQQRLEEAIASFARATELDTSEPHFAYVHAVALNSLNQHDKAMSVLKDAHRRHPRDRDLIIAATTFSRDRGEIDAAIKYARKLMDLDPTDQAARQLLAELHSAREAIE